MPSVIAGRQRKTDMFYDDPVNFVEVLTKDVQALLRKASREGMKPSVRLNGTSDIAWEHQRGKDGTSLLERFQDVQFYDYTKLPGRKVPENYDLTVSFSGADPAYAAKVLNSSHRIAVVGRGEEPIVWAGRQVLNGDKHDVRFLDPKGVVIWLKPKGKAKHDTSGFVVDV